MESIKKFLKDILTEVDNTTFDFAKILAVVAVVNGLALATYEVVGKGSAFNFQDFGTGVGIMFAGLAAVLGFKKETNDKPKP